MERVRLMSLAAASTLAATLATAASLPSADALKARFFADSPATSNLEAPPAAHAARVNAASGLPPGTNYPNEPDWSFTPGRLCTASDPDFKEYRYAEQIPYCNRNVTQQMKQQVAAHYGVPQSQWSNYEFDHLIPLAIGGDSHVDNLWPEPNSQNQGSGGKDALEERLYLQMKAGTIKQADAVKQIYDWFKTNHPEMAAQMTR